MPKTSKEIVELVSETFHNKQTIWFSEQEIKDNLRKVEKKIDETKDKFLVASTYGKSKILKELEELKQILNDCFGIGK